MSLNKRFFYSLLVCFGIVLSSVSNSLFADELDSQSVNKLELVGGESFGYDIGNKIRKAKSNFNVGIGMNLQVSTNNVHVNASVIAGYSYFFHKTFGLRGYGIFDNFENHFYGAAGIDIIWDFFQIENFGIGIIVGSSAGYSNSYRTSVESGFLGQFHVGLGMNFDSGKSRLEGLVRIPYNNINNLNHIFDVETTYIIMYSYTF